MGGIVIDKLLICEFLGEKQNWKEQLEICMLELNTLMDSNYVNTEYPTDKQFDSCMLVLLINIDRV